MQNDKLIELLKSPALVHENEASLHTPCKLMTEEQMRLVENLYNPARDLMRKKKGVGLAAPQIGIPLRFFIWKKGIAMNPEILEVHGKQVQSKEGCLSFPSLENNPRLAVVPRHLKIRVRYTKRGGTLVEETLEELDAVVFQHESDHLDGICIFERMPLPIEGLDTIAGPLYKGEIGIVKGKVGVGVTWLLKKMVMQFVWALDRKGVVLLSEEDPMKFYISILRGITGVAHEMWREDDPVLLKVGEYGLTEADQRAVDEVRITLQNNLAIVACNRVKAVPGNLAKAQEVLGSLDFFVIDAADRLLPEPEHAEKMGSPSKIAVFMSRAAVDTARIGMLTGWLGMRTETAGDTYGMHAHTVLEISKSDDGPNRDIEVVKSRRTTGGIIQTPIHYI